MRIAILVGSIRADSFNLQLARAIAQLGPPDWVYEHIDIHELPLYNQDHDGAMPPVALRLKQRIESADGLLFVTPEYNRSIPGVLKNAIDIASRPYGKNSFAGKPAGVIGTSIGAIGTAVAQSHLRGVLAYLDVPVLGQPEAYIHYREGLVDAAGHITDDKVRPFIERWVAAWRDFVVGHVERAGGGSRR
ncbi:NAD(P)H-dependent oxidoreductase [Ideonella sp.]|uniref:NADPH-dependent FMN reductase n=1 Tax=Ideonella sp. TaxID=1929293 RepID=UPI002B47F04D|nr:NAD(P)H-dependent oxidoreductase [Ideonella sp.]HJV71344.1 NAD(P)H-dependent oxidoreductase [Ideonella sp.]